VPGTNGDALAAQLRGEMAEIRGLIERQLAGFAWGELARESPVKSVLLGELLEAGFSGDLARRLVDEIGSASDMAIARNAVRNTLSRDLITLGSDADIIDRGGVYALVGPTGVGKTTTTAKLAARCVVRHGAEKLALLTTDGYRIGAHEQLKIYGRILGVSVYSVRDTSELRRTLAELRGKHMVLIDTVGMSQRDRAVAEQAAMLLQAGKIERLLLLNATSRGDTLDDVVRAYSGPDLAGCILTKVDESVSLASAIDVVVRHRLGMFYVANGQRVPEDLHLPNRPYLLHRSLKTCPESSAHHLIGGEAGLLLAAGAGAARAGQGAQLG
jgi:flagellar biosynthesis protein FlhF